MKNIVELREKLAGIVNGLGDGSVDVKTACEQNNAAGKIINTVKIQIAYAIVREEKPDIKFMTGSVSQGQLQEAGG